MRGAAGLTGGGTALAAAVALAAASCKGRAPVHRQQGSGAAVEVVAAPSPAPGGAEPSRQGAGAPPAGPVVEEREPDDDVGAASPLPLGGAARGRLDRPGDVDAYAIDVPSDGALALALSGVEGVDLLLEVRDPTGALIATSDRGAARAAEGVPNLGVRRGRYVATVRAARRRPGAKGATDAKGAKGAKDAKGAKGSTGEPRATGATGATDEAPSAPYELAAALGRPPEGAEVEPDDDRGAAGDLVLGAPASGWIGWAGDVDVWKLSVEPLAEADALDVDLAAVDGVALTLELADGLGRPVVARTGARGAAIALRGLRAAASSGAPPFAYVTVRGDRSNPEAPYHLTARGRPRGAGDEVEPNDDAARAQPLPPTPLTTVRGAWTAGDVDCFALPPARAARRVEATLRPPAGADLVVELVAGEDVLAHSGAAEQGGARRAAAEVPAGARALVRVRAAGGRAGAEGAYELAIADAGRDELPVEEDAPPSPVPPGGTAAADGPP